MKQSLIGLLAVLVSGAIFYAGWVKYEAFLTSGSALPEGMQKLNEISSRSDIELSFEDLEGRAIDLKQFRGKGVILNFWASWCDPCVEEFPSMISLVKHFKGDLVMIAISADRTREDLDAFLKAFQVKGENIYIGWDQDMKLAKRFGTVTLPESYIIGPSGKFVRKIVGVENWSTEGALGFFQSLVEGKLDSPSKEEAEVPKEEV